MKAAISSKAQTRKFYFIKPKGIAEDLPYWYNQLGSFHKDVILKHASEIPDLSARIEETEMECRTFSDMVKSENIDKFDILVIDTEGADGEIVHSINFSLYLPHGSSTKSNI